MIKKLQKQSLSFRKKILISIVLVVSFIAIIPLWLFGLNKTLNYAADNRVHAAPNETSELDALRAELSATLEQMRLFREEIKELTQQGLQNKPLSTPPGTGPTLPRSEPRTEESLP